ncbi:MAG: TldD/PmbA family protein [Candidatus Micrarchaeota archaeon]
MSQHEVFRVSAKSADLTFTGGELKIKEADQSSGIAVRALHEGRLGFSFCQDEAGLQDALERARRMSHFSVKSGFSFAPEAPYDKPDIVDPSLDPENLEELRGIVEQVREAASIKGGRPRVISQVQKAEVSISNTSGLEGGYEKTSFSIYAECMNNNGFGMSFSASCRKPADIIMHGSKAAEMALATQNAGKPESGAYIIVMEVQALESLIETLLPSLSGDWRRRKTTKLSLGEKAFSDTLTISEDGLSLAAGARPFDDEGTPSARCALIEKGIVKSFMYDRETAALDGVEECGMCNRNSYDSPPSIGSSNLVISPGSWKSLGELDRFIEVHHAHGSHTANVTTGDIGLEVSAAFMVEKGKRKPVKGFMMSGNIFDMFKGIEAIEDKQQTVGSLISPRIAFRNVRIIA